MCVLKRPIPMAPVIRPQCVSAFVDAKFVEGFVDVVLDRVGGKIKHSGNLLIGQASRKELEYVHLSDSQALAPDEIVSKMLSCK